MPLEKILIDREPEINGVDGYASPTVSVELPFL